MKPIFLSLAIVATLFSSCKKRCDTSHDLLSGTYSGTFNREGFVVGPFSNVTLHFTGDRWSGTSSAPRFPALCNGSYTALGADSIRFQNDCVFTTDFDHTLILSKDWAITINGDSLELTRNLSSSARDVYRLKKQ